MTIYTAKNPEKKEEKEHLNADPEVCDGSPPIKDYEKVPQTLVALRLKRRTNLTNFCLLLTALLVLATGFLGGIYLYKHLAHRTFRGWCGVRYYEYQEEETPVETRISSIPQEHRGHRRRMVKHEGRFEEQVELDHFSNTFERFEMPEFEECKRSTVLHDFEKNMTAIVDRDHLRCYVMPLNRTTIKPPKDFWDMLSKLRTGYYMPDAEVVRERYRIVLPVMRNLSPLGYYIWQECHEFTSYKLERISNPGPTGIAKRSARNVVSFGIPGGSILPIITIVD